MLPTMENVYLVDITRMKDISGLCRVCLLNDDNMTSIYKNTEDFNEKTTTIFNELQQLSKIKLSKDPVYPSFICPTCLSLLKISWKIRVQMRLSQKQLVTYFSNHGIGSKINSTDEESQIEAKQKVTTEPFFQKAKAAPVELISNQGRFNLKELIIVEEKKEEDEEEESRKCYEGFLRNLGSVISAEFADRNSWNKENVLEDPVVNIIPLKDKENENTESPTPPATCLNEAPRKVVQTNSQFSNETFLCQVCGFITKKKYQLAYHISSQHSIKKYKCDICNKGYSVQHRLQQHKAVHKNERPFLCTVCGNNFNYRSALEYHMRMHTGERRYKCTYCPKAFSMSWGLKRHLTIHTGARPCKCRFCGKGFASTGELKCHVLLHTGERPHRCQVCKKGFTKNYNLKVHMLSHKGPLKCSFCRRGFLDPSILKVHYKISHRMRKDDADNIIEESEVYDQTEEEDDEERETEQDERVEDLEERLDEEEEELGEDEEQEIGQEEDEEEVEEYDQEIEEEEQEIEQIEEQEVEQEEEEVN